jgi:hypothetical protein
MTTLSDDVAACSVLESEAVVNTARALQLVADAVDVARPVLGPPTDWTGRDARTDGSVLIPDHVDPTNPRRVYEVDDRAECKYLYEIVLTDGTPADINRLIDQTLLVELWDRLYLPHDVRAAWAQTVSSRRLSIAAATASTPTRHSRSDREHPSAPRRATPVRIAPAARSDGEPIGPRRPNGPEVASYGVVYGSSCCG